MTGERSQDDPIRKSPPSNLRSLAEWSKNELTEPARRCIVVPEMKTLCVQCEHLFDVPEADLGRDVTCPECGAAFAAGPHRESEPGAVPLAPRKKRFPAAMSLPAVAVGCDVLCTANLIGSLIFFLIFFFRRTFASLFYAALLFSVSWALFAASSIIKHARENARSTDKNA